MATISTAAAWCSLHVWVRLDALFARVPDASRHVIETGLDLTGEVQGRLHGRFPTDATSCDWSTNSFRSTHCGSALRLFEICWDATAVILAR